MSINKVIVAGNLTRDPELRETRDGLQILSFGVAVNDRWKNQQTQQWEDRPNFVDCAMFGNRAASVAQLLIQGREGRHRGKAALVPMAGEGRNQPKQADRRRRRNRVLTA